MNGNAHLLYPHASGPVETLRWKYVAKGVEIFDMLSMLKKSYPAEYGKIEKSLPEVKDMETLDKLYANITDVLSK